ncbi:MAG: hypothetical protein CMK07_07340 [Ponticaulis sp.]|nr:hypothetical protein [Ponticaulis sp.]
MAFNSKFSFTHGTVITAQRMSQTSVSGGGNNTAVTSSTSHWTEVRIKHRNGTQDDYNVSGRYSPGDELTILWFGKKRVGDKNHTTSTWWSKRNKYTPIGSVFFWLLIAVVVVASFAIGFMTIAFGGIGLLIMGFGVWCIFAALSFQKINRQTWDILSRLEKDTPSMDSLG